MVSHGDSASSHPPRTLAAGMSMQAASLVQAARVAELVIYAGAGLSRSAGLPVGSALARRLHARLVEMGQPVDSVSDSDLLEIARFAEEQPGGLAVLQQLCLEVAPFTEASPTYEHVVLALLLVEEAVSVITTNWDTCIERGLPGAQIAAVVTDEDRLQYRGARLYKVHGCALRPATLLISETQLKQPPAWANADVAAALGHAVVVFLGIGDVAPYVRVRLAHLLERLGPSRNVRVVGPDIVRDWESSQWSILMPTLSASDKIAQTAEVFLDDLIRAWVLEGLNQCRRAAADSTAIREALERLIEQLNHMYPHQIVMWLRDARVSRTACGSAVFAATTAQALLGLAVLAGSKQLFFTKPHEPARLGTGRVTLLIGDGLTPGRAAAREARERVASLRLQGIIRPEEEVVVVCAGHATPVAPRRAAELADNIIGEGDPVDVLDGPPASSLRLLGAQSLIEDAE